MKTRKIGSFEVSEVAMGCMAFLTATAARQARIALLALFERLSGGLHAL